MPSAGRSHRGLLCNWLVGKKVDAANARRIGDLWDTASLTWRRSQRPTTQRPTTCRRSPQRSRRRPLVDVRGGHGDTSLLGYWIVPLGLVGQSTYPCAYSSMKCRCSIPPHTLPRRQRNTPGNATRRSPMHITRAPLGYRNRLDKKVLLTV